MGKIIMANIIQRILVRTDLGFPVGLMAAQVAHIHMEGLRWAINRNRDNKDHILMANIQGNFRCPKEAIDLNEWLKSPYIFVHGVPNLEVLMHFREKAEKEHIPVFLWQDTVNVRVSENQNIPFKDIPVGIALGPIDSDMIKIVVGDLPLL